MATDKKISQLASGAPAEAGDEYVVARGGANYKLTLTNIAGNMPATTISSGNLNFSSTAQRITGDMSNATLANRVSFQSSTTNGQTSVGLIPNGTSTTSQINFETSSTDLTNASYLQVRNTGSESGFDSNKRGTGSYLPMIFYTGGSERVRIDTSGNVGIGGTATASTRVEITGTGPSSGGVTRGFRANVTVPSATTTAAANFASSATTEAASFTLTTFQGFSANGISIGAGSTVTNQYGFIANDSLTEATNNFGFHSNIAAASNRWNFYAAGTARNYFAGGVEDANGNLRKIPQSGSAKTTSYSLATTDVGLFIEVGSGGSITVPNSTFSAGDVVSIFNNTSGNVTLTMSITTAYIGGTDADKATITLATRGVATILFISGTVCVVNGNVS
jgi:hypothetical protein